MVMPGPDKELENAAMSDSLGSRFSDPKELKPRCPKTMMGWMAGLSALVIGASMYGYYKVSEYMATLEHENSSLLMEKADIVIKNAHFAEQNYLLQTKADALEEKVAQLSHENTLLSNENGYVVTLNRNLEDENDLLRRLYTITIPQDGNLSTGIYCKAYTEGEMLRYSQIVPIMNCLGLENPDLVYPYEEFDLTDCLSSTAQDTQ